MQIAAVDATCCNSINFHGAALNSASSLKRFGTISTRVTMQSIPTVNYADFSTRNYRLRDCSSPWTTNVWKYDASSNHLFTLKTEWYRSEEDLGKQVLRKQTASFRGRMHQAHVEGSYYFALSCACCVYKEEMYCYEMPYLRKEGFEVLQKTKMWPNGGVIFILFSSNC